MDVKSPVVVVLGTGGTIAGTGSGPDEVSYRAAQLSVEQLLQAVPGLAGVALETLQVAQIDSKDMDWSVWQALAQQVQLALARRDVGAVVITHGTDTLEETAYLLHRLLDAHKPVVLTAAMRAATSAQADGPRNLHDAVRVAEHAAARGWAGVVVVMAGVVWPGHAVRKSHTWHIDDAFDGGGDEPLGHVTDSGAILGNVPWPSPGGAGWSCLDAARPPPRVEIVTSHAGADGRLVEALLAQSQRAGHALGGLVVAGTGHGTIHQGLTRALEKAEQQGVKVWRSSRVARGGVQSRESDHWPAAGTLTAAQARLALMLDLLGVPCGGMKD
ncbi:asparaginase [Aquabacterium sp.]|uniref:asparaginase n=1 Tax=Aquabacterium sp. TaxID=1872578 RepID=UPI001989665D|nr:asparaginase [Aquabacterium sp.]MBC7699977.1 asparaginase [Aquabacterium sp.]